MAIRGRQASFEFVSYVDKVEKQIEQGLRKNLLVAIKIWQRSLIIQMSGERTGRLRYKRGTKVLYRASSPGPPPESPAAPTGTTRRSYYTEVSREALKAYLGSELDVAMWLERGTSRMARRPSLEPAFQRVRDQLEKALRERIDG